MSADFQPGLRSARPIGAPVRWHRLAAPTWQACLLVLLISSRPNAIPDAAAQGVGAVNLVSLLTRVIEAEIVDDGSVRVVERWTVSFAGGPHSLLAARIPLPTGTEARVLDVGEPNRPYAAGALSQHGFVTERSKDALAIRWAFPPVFDDSRTFIVDYVLTGALAFGAEEDTWQWTPVAEGGPAIGLLIITIVPPPTVPALGSVDAQHITVDGNASPLPVVSREQDGSRLRVRELGEGESVQLHVRWPAHLITRPLQATSDRRSSNAANGRARSGPGGLNRSLGLASALRRVDAPTRLGLNLLVLMMSALITLGLALGATRSGLARPLSSDEVAVGEFGRSMRIDAPRGPFAGWSHGARIALLVAMFVAVGLAALALVAAGLWASIYLAVLILVIVWLALRAGAGSGS